MQFKKINLTLKDFSLKLILTVLSNLFRTLRTHCIFLTHFITNFKLYVVVKNSKKENFPINFCLVNYRGTKL
jgi:hypothetical protein